MFWVKTLFWIIALGLYFSMFPQFSVPNNTPDKGLIKSSIPLNEMVLELYSKDMELKKFHLRYFIQHSRKNPATVFKRNLLNLKGYPEFLEFAERLSGLTQEEVNTKVIEILSLAKQHPFQILVQSPKESAHGWTTYWQSSQLLNEISNEDDNTPWQIVFTGLKKE